MNESIEVLRRLKPYFSIRGIEKALGMPDSTLIKAVNGVQTLPKKWEPILDEFMIVLENGLKPAK